MTDNNKPLLDTEEQHEEEISLVSSSATDNHNANTLDKDAINDRDVNIDWDEQPTKKPHPLSSSIVVEDYDSDPWAQPESALLDETDTLQVEEFATVATTTVFDDIDENNKTEVVKQEYLDDDTSAIKVTLTSFWIFL